MASGVLGRGTYQTVISGAAARLPPHSYYNCARELLELEKCHVDVLKQFYVRDRILDMKLPAGQRAHGHFYLLPMKRRELHLDGVMTAIRKRSLVLMRIRKQRAINQRIVEAQQSEGASNAQGSLATPDSDVYFAPMSVTAYNTWPNFWQHPSECHVIPRVTWQRHKELGGITRVSKSPTLPPSHF